MVAPSEHRANHDRVRATEDVIVEQPVAIDQLAAGGRCHSGVEVAEVVGAGMSAFRCRRDAQAFREGMSMPVEEEEFGEELGDRNAAEYFLDPRRPVGVLEKDVGVDPGDLVEATGEGANEQVEQPFLVPQDVVAMENADVRVVP